MVLVKLGLPKDENIVSRNKFVVNRIFPIAIRSTTVPDQFIVLFIAYQDYDESFLYFQMMVKVENAFEQTYLENHELNLNRFQNNKNDKSLEVYQKLISKITEFNVYATDFNMISDPERPFYFSSTCVRAIDKTHASVMDIYFTTDNFIKMQIYLNRFINAPSSKLIHEEIFRDQKYHNIEVVNIESVKMDCTKEESAYELMNFFTTHYTMHCGPSKYVMNWSIVETSGRPLKVPLDVNLYNTFYQFHHKVTDVFIHDDYLYILYIEKSEVDGSYKKTKILKLNKELTDKTNFKDSLNIFINQEDK